MIFFKNYIKKIKNFKCRGIELSHKLNHYIFGTKCCRPQIFQTMNSVGSNILSLKYQNFTTSGSKDIGVLIFEFVAKTQFLSKKFYTHTIHVLRVSLSCIRIACSLFIFQTSCKKIKLILFYYIQLNYMHHAASLVLNCDIY